MQNIFNMQGVLAEIGILRWIEAIIAQSIIPEYWLMIAFGPITYTPWAK